MPRPNPKTLTAREQEFVRRVGAGETPTSVARSMGTNPTQLMKRDRVKNAIQETAKAVQVKREYDLVAAMDELDEKIQLATEAGQYSAVAKMVELKMKGHGLLVEKLDVTNTGFQLVFGAFGQVPRKSQEQEEDELLG